MPSRVLTFILKCGRKIKLASEVLYALFSWHQLEVAAGGRDCEGCVAGRSLLGGSALFSFYTLRMAFSSKKGKKEVTAKVR